MQLHRSSTRLVLMLIVGLLVAAATGVLVGWEVAPITGWAAACVLYIARVWFTVGRMDAASTASHATREDPNRGISDLLVLLASVASLGAIVFLLIQAHASSNSQKVELAVLAVLSVALSWSLIHTLFTLRYASLYYGGPDGGVNFNQTEPPQYTDFAYLAFTLGMTFQVSDTNLQTHVVRATALRHALLSYVFGTVILATLINLLAGLGG
ncbi:DUF1345 domain-containing protein [Glaciibacter sp. 2TAF33]|uniref:DUF1345 domain-containing protein n=1 Tax=Glaciibacter sp. 2TAF33 TaxID=3233015 RepID=UPI003F9251D2